MQAGGRSGAEQRRRPPAVAGHLGAGGDHKAFGPKDFAPEVARIPARCPRTIFVDSRSWARVNSGGQKAVAMVVWASASAGVVDGVSEQWWWS